MENLLTSEEMASVLRVSLKTFRNLIKEKGLPFYEVGGQYRFDKTKVLKKLEKTGEKFEVETVSKSKITVEHPKKRNEFYDALGL